MNHDIIRREYDEIQTVSIQLFTIVLTLVFFVFPVSAQEVPENLQEAAAHLREGIKNWENLVTVTFTTDLDSFDGTTASANALAEQILDLALAHTGQPDEGINSNGEPEGHAWNLVQLDGQYYYLDSTWDAGMYDYMYFLKSANDFYNHTPDPEYLTDAFRTEYSVATWSYDHPVLENMVDGDYEYRVVNGGAILLKYNGTEQHVTVPARLGGYPVYVIGMEAFHLNDYIVSLTFSEGIRLMETCAIVSCGNLKSVHIPSTMNFTASNEPDFLCRVICGPYMCPNVETITVAEGNPYLTVHDGVLYNKEMTILRYYPSGDPREVFRIPEGVLSIGSSVFAGNEHIYEVIMADTVVRVQMGAFEYCSRLEKITISNSCRWIDQYVFSGTAPESIHIPASVVRLYFGSFGVQSEIKNITVDPENPVYYVEDGVLYANITEEHIASSCDIPGIWLVKYPVGGEETSFTVPEGVVFIDQHAFDSCGHLREIILPDSLEVMYVGSLWGCSGLTELELPDNLREIHDSAFDEVTGLATLVFPESVEKLGYCVIPYNHHLDNVVFLGDAPELTDQTFAGLTLNIYYPAGNTTWDAVIQMYAHEPGVRFVEMCETHHFESASREPSGCIISGYEGRRCSVCRLVEADTVMPAPDHQLNKDGICIRCISQSGSATYSPLSTEEQQEMLRMLLLMLALFCAAIAIPVVIVRMLRRRKHKQQ